MKGRKLVINTLSNQRTDRQGTACCTHHFKPVCKATEIGIFLVALDDRGFHSFPRTFDENLRAIYREELDFLQLSNTPEQDLWWAERNIGGLQRPLSLGEATAGIPSPHIPFGMQDYQKKTNIFLNLISNNHQDYGGS